MFAGYTAYTTLMPKMVDCSAKRPYTSLISREHSWPEGITASVGAPVAQELEGTLYSRSHRL